MELTERQWQALRFFDRHRRERGYAPSVRELQREIGLRSCSSAQHYVDALTERGLITSEPGKKRTTRLTDSGWAALAQEGVTA